MAVQPATPDWYRQSLHVRLLYETQLMALTCVWHQGIATAGITAFISSSYCCYDSPDLFVIHLQIPLLRADMALNPSEGITQHSSWQRRLHRVAQPKQGSKWEQLGSYVSLIMRKKM